MREILFRGKRTDNGEWIYGYRVKLGRESFSDPERYGICNKAIPLGGSGVCYNLKIDEVVPETVGQYTGLTDRNGKQIFEGDIVTTDLARVHLMVEFRVGCRFIFNRNDGGKDCHDIMLPIENESRTEYEYGEVIGNIYDNPELLGGEDNG